MCQEGVGSYGRTEASLLTGGAPHRFTCYTHPSGAVDGAIALWTAALAPVVSLSVTTAALYLNRLRHSDPAPDATPSEVELSAALSKTAV
jgi:hypothetical protein